MAQDRPAAPTSAPPAPGATPPSREAAFFDLDKTVIATSSSTAFSRPFLAAGLLTRRAALRSVYAQLRYLLGPADERQTERLRAQLSRTIAGWDVSRVRAIVADTLHEAIDPMVYAEAVALMQGHREAGRDVVLVSASASEIVEPIAAVLGADAVVATRMAVADGRYTGRIELYVYGEYKAVAIRALADERGYDLSRCYAYSDSVTDLPMLQAVGHGFVVNPDRALRRVAVEHGWGVLTFVRPAPLFPVPHADRRLATAAGGAALAAVAGVALRHLARRGRTARPRTGRRGRAARRRDVP